MERPDGRATRFAVRYFKLASPKRTVGWRSAGDRRAESIQLRREPDALVRAVMADALVTTLTDQPAARVGSTQDHFQHTCGHLPACRRSVSQFRGNSMCYDCVDVLRGH